MKVNDFIHKLREVEKKPSIYKLGKFMNVKDGKFILCDCSGLIKGILWGYPGKTGKYLSNGVPDINANTMISRYCQDVSTDFSVIIPGELVWMSGHIGVYIGDGNVIESSPRWENGIQITRLSQRTWIKHGKFRYIDYNTIVSKSIDEIAKEVINGKWGNGSQRKERLTGAGYDYKEVQAKVNEMLKG